MKFLIIALLFSLGLSGCAPMQGAQTQMDKLGATYADENAKLTTAVGTRYYKISKEKAQSAMLLALTNLDVSVENQDLKSGFINGKSTLPKPLSQAEFDRAWAIEGPRAKEITGYDIFWPGTIDLISNILINERSGDVQVNIRFRMKHTIVKEDWVILTQIPPEVARVAYRKLWDEFEKVAFVQEKVISGNEGKNK